MSVTAIYEKLCSVNLGSSGILTAPTAIPTALNESELPCAITIPGPAEWNEHAVGFHRQVRTYIIRVYVKPVALGKGVDEGYQACLAPLNALGLKYLDDLSLGNTVDEIRQPFTDSGIQVLEYAGVAYHGFEFKLEVTEKST